MNNNPAAPYVPRSTFPRLRVYKEPGLHQVPKYVALGYDSAGHLVWQATHG